jgi:hypothetical protein
MNVALASSRVPSEYVGRARQLRDAIGVEDKPAGEMMAAMLERLKARIARGNKIPRVDTLVGIAREWQRNIPVRGRLAIEVNLDKRKKSLRIREMRLTTGEYQPPAWDVAERGLIIELVTLEAQPFRCVLGIHNLAHLGLHAIARRFQRGLDDSEAAILRDMRLLGEAQHGLADRPEGADFVVGVPGGHWRGHVSHVYDRRIGRDVALAVRTFVDGDSRAATSVE